MKGLCTFEKCYFGQLLDSKEQCPNYMEHWFYPKDKDPESIEDCAPRRTVEMLKDIHARLIALQKTDDQQRNVSADLVSAFGQVINTINENPSATLQMAISPKKQIEK